MNILRLIIFAFALLPSFSLTAKQSEVKWSTKVEYLSEETYRVVFTAQITTGWHMYDLGPYDDLGPNATEFTFHPSEGIILDGKVAELDKPVRKFDEMFGMEIGYYQNKARFAQKFKLKTDMAELKSKVGWSVCDSVSCMPPEENEIIIKVTAIHKIHSSLPGEQAVSVEPDSISARDIISSAQEVPDSLNAFFTTTKAATDGSLWALIIEAILWGLAAIVTPCVFPMVPMTVSFFMKGSENPAKGRFRASVYGFFIVALYTLPIAAIILITRIVGGEAVTADIFNWVSTHWLPNIIFFLVFMVFAASFFGAFEITLPGWMVNKSDKNADRAGLGGVFFMALTLVLVSFSCTGPIVTTIVIKATAGEFWTPIITMLAFSITFALPFTLLAFFPALLNKIPKSGGWLNSVKVVLGFIEVALGLKFLSVADQTYHWGILDREVYLAIWIVVFSLMGAYLLGKIKFRYDSDVKHIGVGRLALVIIVFSFVVYMIPGMFGAPLKKLSGYMPPMHTQDFVAGNGTVSNDSKFKNVPKYSEFLHLPHNLSGFFDLDEAQEYANNIGKPLFVDITGHGCVNCREMEARVWADPKVLELLRNDFVIVALYVDDKKTLPESDWVTTENGRVLKGLGKINSYLALKHFGRNAQPYYLIVGRAGKPLVSPRGYDLNIPDFMGFLQNGIEAYR